MSFLFFILPFLQQRQERIRNAFTDLDEDSINVSFPQIREEVLTWTSKQVEITFQTKPISTFIGRGGQHREVLDQNLEAAEG